MGTNGFERVRESAGVGEDVRTRGESRYERGATGTARARRAESGEHPRAERWPTKRHTHVSPTAQKHHEVAEHVAKPRSER
jgi:hypothetical protein